MSTPLPRGEFTVTERLAYLNHAAVGVKVSQKGHRDVNLFFDKDKGLLSLIVLEMGGSSRQCATLA